MNEKKSAAYCKLIENVKNKYRKNPIYTKNLTLGWCDLRQGEDLCGVYGCMMHTAFCNKSHSQEVFDNMKKDLQEFIDKDTTADEESIFYEEFTSKY